VILAMALLALFVPALSGRAQAHMSVKQFAKVLLKRDPGKRVGGTSMVGTKPDRVLRGARGRINFMVALVNGDRLVGGNGHDQLTAYPGTRRVRIDGGSGADLIEGMGRELRLFGGTGNDLIYGGPGKDRIHGGPGNDEIYGGPANDTIYGGLGNDVIYGSRGNDTIYGGVGDDTIVDHWGADIVVTGPGHNLVDVADGRGDDRVTCAAGGDPVIAERGDKLSRNCRRLSAHARFAAFARQARLISAADSLFSTTDPLAEAAQNTTVLGDGSNDRPDTTPENGCYDPGNHDSHVVNCFAARTLTTFWQNEYVPAYACPSDFPFLLNQNYAPFGTALINGAQVYGLGPIGVSITGALSDTFGIMAEGTATGGANSSATNGFGTNSYQVVLHCVNDASRGWTVP
jgi:RTX calcium-binding nonapeptide repeat (4 copies)